MVENNQDSGVIQLGERPKVNTFADIMKSDLAKELIIPVAKQVIRKEFGVGTADKQVAAKPFGRAMYALRDVWQGIWWTIPALAFSMMIVVLIWLYLKKVLGL